MNLVMSLDRFFVPQVRHILILVDLSPLGMRYACKAQAQETKGQDREPAEKQARVGIQWRRLLFHLVRSRVKDEEDSSSACCFNEGGKRTRNTLDTSLVSAPKYKNFNPTF